MITLEDAEKLASEFAKDNGYLTPTLRKKSYLLYDELDSFAFDVGIADDKPLEMTGLPEMLFVIKATGLVVIEKIFM